MVRGGTVGRRRRRGAGTPYGSSRGWAGWTRSVPPLLGHPADAELVADGGDVAAGIEVDFDELRAAHGFGVFVLEDGRDFAGFRVDHLGGGGVGPPAVAGEGDPAVPALADLDPGDLPGGPDGVVEDVDGV